MGVRGKILGDNVFVSNTALKTCKTYPEIFVFRNLERGQVAYSLRPALSTQLIQKQFLRPNWQNRIPTNRPDVWSLMAVVSFARREEAKNAFNELVKLRRLRDVDFKKDVNEWRHKNEEGNIWSSAQYRPVYAQEAVSDIASTIDYLKYKSVIFWEDAWRRGEGKHWNNELVQHKEFDRTAIKTPQVLIKDIKEIAAAEFKKLSQEATNADITGTGTGNVANQEATVV